MKKILILSKHIGLSGVTTNTLVLSKYLIKLGYKVYIASSGGYYLKDLKKLSIHHFNISFNIKKNFFINILNLLLLVKKIKPDILHCQWQITNIYAYIASKCFNIPFLSVLHLSDIKMGFLRKYSPWGDLSVAISRETYKELIYKYHINKEKITLIYNGVDLEKLKPPMINEKLYTKKRYGISTDTIVISMVARLVEVKGAEYLINAVSKVNNRYKIKIIFTGEGPLRKKLEVLAKKLKVDAEFTGWVDDVREVLCASDIFVLPSRQEGFPLAPIEAMAMMVPVIRSKTAGAYDQIKNNHNGILINYGSSDEIKNALIKIIKNHEFRETITKNAYRSVIQKFSANSMVKRYTQEYEKLLR